MDASKIAYSPSCAADGVARRPRNCYALEFCRERNEELSSQVIVGCPRIRRAAIAANIGRRNDRRIFVQQIRDPGAHIETLPGMPNSCEIKIAPAGDSRVEIIVE